MAQKKEQERQLRGWKEIANFLSQHIATVQRWAKSGMPVTRKGRYMVASPEEVRRWLGKETGTGAPVQIASDDAELSKTLKRSLSQARRHRRNQRAA